MVMRLAPKMKIGVVLMLMGFAGFSSCERSMAGDLPEAAHDWVAPTTPEQPHAVAVLAGGCLWCTEAVFEQLQGVESVESGYAGGTPETAQYKAVSAGVTDHAEVIAVTYDPHVISYGRLLQVFMSVAHDPTQLDRQGPDRGRQYRSAVFWAHEDERAAAEAYIAQLEEAKVFGSPIVTTLEPLEAFYPAEAYHQDYVQHNPAQPYVAYNALPNVEKLRKSFPVLVK